MSKHFTRIFAICIALLFTLTINAQNNFFTDANELQFRAANLKRVIIPQKYRTVALDLTAITGFLNNVPSEKNIVRELSPVIDIPMPDGTTGKFHIWESAVMEPGLAAKFPSIKTFSGQGIDDPSAIIKMDLTELGFHAMIVSGAHGTVFIDPYAQGVTINYISYFKIDFQTGKRRREINSKQNNIFDNNNLSARKEKVKALVNKLSGKVQARPANVLQGACIGAQLRTYRLVIACTHQYAAAATGQVNPTVTQTMAAITTTANRVNGVYERELSIRLILVSNNNLVAFNSETTDPLTANNNPETLLSQGQTQIDNKIGSGNYDIGHTFSTGAGGLAYIGVVCQAGQKAYGVTGIETPVGDPFDIDYVCHEMGHQFGAEHPFNAQTGYCSGNAVQTSNVEPGSGSTIMGYAGLCDNNDLQQNSDAYFNGINFDQITEYVVNGTGGSCAAITPTGNVAPVVNAGATYTIPKSTPFFLTGSATDANDNALTYSWEEMDFGGPYSNWDAPSGDAPIFRSFPPVTTATRYFPKLSDVVNNTVTIGEVLPSYTRTMHFRLTARDNRSGGGGVCYDTTSVKVDGDSGPLVVTYPSAAGIVWHVGEFANITWETAGTQLAPVSCANVAIQLSTDGGLTYPVTISANTPNDGKEQIIIPNNVTTKARIRIVAVGNIFYDISDNNFSIQSSPTSFALSTPAVQTVCKGVSNLSATINTASILSFSGNITFSATGNPAGTTVSFSPASVNVGSPVVFTLNNTGGLASGTYNVTATGASGSMVKPVTVSFIIISNDPPVLTAPANNATNVITQPTLTWTAVNGATSYNVEVATSPTFNPVLQNISNLTTTSHTLTVPLAINTTYYWRVSTVAAACNGGAAGSASAARSFKTIESIDTCYFSAADLPLNIPAEQDPMDPGSGFTYSAITIPGEAAVTIKDVDVVGLQGTHSNVNNLAVYLTNPSNTKYIALFDNICQSPTAQNFNLTFDDEAATNVIPCPPTGNAQVQPQDALSAFDGESSAGEWGLLIYDFDYTQNSGILNGWGLRFCASAVSHSFTVTKNADSVTSLLAWSIYEANTSYYLVERSNDGVNFNTIGRLNAPDTAGPTYQYYYTDLKPFTGDNYYRIKQYNKDGSFTYSDIASLSFDKISSGWTIYPNPAHDKLTVVSNANASDIQIQLFDATGKLVYNSKAGNTTAGQYIPINITAFSKGIYALKIMSGSNKQKTEKIFIR